MEPTLTTEDLNILKRAFLRADHEFINGFVYLTEAAVCNRIEEVDPAWTFEVQRLSREADQAVCCGRLTIKGVTREGVGMYRQTNPNGEPEKSAATDAIKRCARLFTVGRYLLNYEPPPKGPDFDTWLTRQQKALGVSVPNAPQAPPASQGATQALPPSNAPTPASGAQNGKPDPKSTVSPASTQNGAQTNGGFEEPDGTPDADGFRRYLVHEIIVNEMGNGGRQYVAKSEIGDNIVVYGGDAFGAAGYDTSKWQANSRPNRLVPPCMIEAKFSGQKWDIRSVEAGY